ncbi:hypothetical protein NRZ30_15795 [Aeromonas jandaei]|uniref:hypothetical protein n=1 Tax=Aeromonas jandaei TaxID=650 RepID=UPI00227CB5E1|nr:hypothetical protein [Aeromonas jandaei]WAG06524.1 hypothetical protein NRZ30_15795 [Aeromonas jandaei]
MAISSNCITRAVPRKIIVVLQIDGNLTRESNNDLLVKKTNGVVIFTNKKGSPWLPFQCSYDGVQAA